MKAALIARSTSALSNPIAINCWIAPSLAEPTLNAFGSPKAAGPAGTAAGCGAGGGDVAVDVAGVAGGGTGIAPGCGAGAELETVGVDTVGAGVDGFAGEAVLVGLGFKSDYAQSGGESTFFTIHTTKSFSWILYDSTVWSSARILPFDQSELIISYGVGKIPE